MECDCDPALLHGSAAQCGRQHAAGPPSQLLSHATRPVAIPKLSRISLHYMCPEGWRASSPSLSRGPCAHLQLDLTRVDLEGVLPSATIMVVTVTASTTAGQMLSEAAIAQARPG